MISGSKNVTTSGTEVQLLASTVENLGRLCARLTIQAKTGNTNNVYVGTSAAVSTSVFGVKLAAGQTYTIGMGETRGNGIDLANIWLDADTNGEGVTWFGEQI